MPVAPQKLYLLLIGTQTLAASLVWGINTLFLLDAGLSNLEAFTANAFFTVGMVVFEVPTGVVADTRGRRTSYLLGSASLSLASLLYLSMWALGAPFWAWAISSMLLGLGFTFFSGALEAWLVDALAHSGHFDAGGTLEDVLAKGEIIEGAAMLVGSVAGGLLAQASNLGVPYGVRAVVLLLNFAVAYVAMRDLGFEPVSHASPLAEVRRVLRESIDHGLRRAAIRWVMLAAVFADGVSFFAFYAMQPYLLQLWGDESAYGIAGIAAAIVAGSQIVGGLLVPYVRRVARRRTSVLLVGTAIATLALAAIGLFPSFWVAIGLLIVWALTFAALLPVRQAFLNGLVDSRHRATVLSFASLLGSGGGAVVQPALGRAADAWGYPASYLCSAAIHVLAMPFLVLARRTRAPSDPTSAMPAGAGSWVERSSLRR